MSKIVVGLSGGVDSAIAAKLLKEQGHEVIGVFMRNWDSAVNNDILGNPNKNLNNCQEELDWNDVKKIAKQLDIQIARVDFIKEYWDDVFKDLITNYKIGRTPNPDILCNKYIKFDLFQKYAFSHFSNVDFIAMGHYADVEDGILKKPKDLWKDQTYFLAQVKKEALKKILFPLSKYKKSEVRQIAKDNNLIVANKKDSTGICFIGERNFTKFLQNYIPKKPGKIVDITTNKIIGDHLGVMYYTIGQRKGLDFGGMKEPYYVVGHDLKKRIIFVAPQSDDSFLLSDTAEIIDVNWLKQIRKNKTLKVKFRYKSKAINCKIKWIDKHSLKVYYSDLFKAVTPGQHAVFYDDNYCLGGGIINKVFYKNKQKTYI